MKTEQLRINVFAFMCMILSSSVFANGGLAQAESWISQQTGIIYGILTVLASGYIMYLVGMAFFNKMQWADVLLGLAKVALGGGVIVIAIQAWQYFGTYQG